MSKSLDFKPRLYLYILFFISILFYLFFYLFWLIKFNSYIFPIRSLGTFIATCLFFIIAYKYDQKTNKNVLIHTNNTLFFILFIFFSTILCVYNPIFWIFSAPILLFFLIHCVFINHYFKSYSICIILSFLIFPFETYFSSNINLILQNMTAELALWMLNFTDLDLIITEYHANPTLLSKDTRAIITPLCAGMEAFLSLIILAVILAGVFIKERKKQFIFIILVIFMGYIINTLRIAISTYAANHLGAGTTEWIFAHDAIGYGIFFGFYLFLFIFIKYYMSEKHVKL